MDAQTLFTQQQLSLLLFLCRCWTCFGSGLLSWPRFSLFISLPPTSFRFRCLSCDASCFLNKLGMVLIAIFQTMYICAPYTVFASWKCLPTLCHSFLGPYFKRSALSSLVCVACRTSPYISSMQTWRCDAQSNELHIWGYIFPNWRIFYSTAFAKQFPPPLPGDSSFITFNHHRGWNFESLSPYIIYLRLHSFVMTFALCNYSALELFSFSILELILT